MSKKDVSAMVSAAGAISSFWTELDKARKELGVSDQDFYGAIKPGSSLIEKFAGLIAGTLRTLKSFPVWLAYNVDSFKVDVKDFQDVLRHNGIRISGPVIDLMINFKFEASANSGKTSFVRIKVRDLGFDEEPTTKDFFDRNRLISFGLDLCEPGDGPCIRLAFTDELYGEWFYVAMEPIADSYGTLRVFCIGRQNDGERWLSTEPAGPDYYWDLEREIVFRSRKQF